MQTGTFYVVATPIGHLDDISARALKTLQTVDAIYAEDTRQTQKLLAHFSINTPIFALHQHNEQGKRHEIESRLQRGESLALVSDAGTPLISDPGFVTIAHLRAVGLPVSPIPGASSVVSALSVSGLPADTFIFAGFLPSKATQRQAVLKQYRYTQSSCVFFESPHRIADCAADFASCFAPNRQVFVARELTKQFEETALLTVLDFPNWLNEHDKRQKGEFVLVLSPSDETPPSDWQALADDLIAAKMHSKTAAELIAKHFAVSKKTAYDYMIQHKTP